MRDWRTERRGDPSLSPDRHDDRVQLEWVAGCEGDDGLDVRVRMCDMRDVSSAVNRDDLHPRKRFRELGNNRHEHVWTRVAEREQGRLVELSNPLEVETKLLWIPHLRVPGSLFLVALNPMGDHSLPSPKSGGTQRIQNYHGWHP